MKLTEEILANHRNLSPHSEAFVRFAETDGRALNRMHFAPVVKNSTFSYLSLSPWPTFIGPERNEECREAAVKVFRLIKSIPWRFFDFDASAISDYYCIPMKDIRFMLRGVTRESVDRLLSRGDFILTSEGFKCLEFNIQANLGGWELNLLESLYFNIPAIRSFVLENQLRPKSNQLFLQFFGNIIDYTRKYAPGGGRLNIAVVYRKVESGGTAQGSYLQQVYSGVLRNYAGGEFNGAVRVCGMNDLEIREDGVYLRNVRIHGIIEMVNGDVPETLLKAAEKDQVLILNGPVTRIMSNKLNLALLSLHEDSDLFTPEEREVIKRYIPWSRKTEAGETTFHGKTVLLEDFVAGNREHLVLKAGEGLSGKLVFHGPSTPRAEWEAAVRKAFSRKAWIVQELLHTGPLMHQWDRQGMRLLSSVWGLFAFGNNYAGGYLRVLPADKEKQVINTKQGAEESVLLVVDR